MRACLLAIAVAAAACTSAPGSGACPTTAPDGTPGPTGAVDVRVGDAGYQGAWNVVVIDAAGTTIHPATSNGHVQVTVHPPASVTAVSAPGAYILASVLDVQAGDHL